VWEDVAGSTVILSQAGADVLTELNTGDYRVTVTQISTGCVAAPVVETVESDFFIPVVDVAVTPQTACVGTNGILAATVDETAIGGSTGVNVDYTFTWYPGAAPVGTPVGTTTGVNGEVEALAGNQSYTVLVTRTTTGCQNTATAYVPEEIELPSATIVTSNQTQCDPADGQLVATVAQV